LAIEKWDKTNKNPKNWKIIMDNPLEWGGTPVSKEHQRSQSGNAAVSQGVCIAMKF
jgi:hypothetical protein